MPCPRPCASATTVSVADALPTALRLGFIRGSSLHPWPLCLGLVAVLRIGDALPTALRLGVIRGSLGVCIGDALRLGDGGLHWL